MALGLGLLHSGLLLVGLWASAGPLPAEPVCRFNWQGQTLYLSGQNPDFQLDALLLCQADRQVDYDSCQPVDSDCARSAERSCVYEHRQVSLRKATHLRCLIREGPLRGAIYGRLRSAPSGKRPR
ncbi:MAG: hypothetical protein AB7I41_16505 [Candidatus Sericytochromatia bacterium]